MENMKEIANRWGTDKFIHGFAEIYENHFAPIRDKVTSLLEIGIHEGKSLRMWSEYFHNCPVIIGWDVNAYETDEFGRRIVTAVVNQERLDETAFILQGPQLDVIVEDGGHTMKGQQMSLAYLWPRLKPGGTFIVEDLHTSLPGDPYEWIGGGCLPDFSNSSLEALKGLQKTGMLRSVYMTSEQISLIERECESCRIFDTKGDGRHITSILVKKL
jgi:formylmethanofuran dehydrogenase subunit D